MNFIDLLLIAIGLSMDAFAVSVCNGLKMKKINYKDTFFIALCFGGFQAFMPFLGWFLGTNFVNYIEAYSHYLSFALLAFIGGKMLKESFEKEENKNDDYKFDIKEILLLGVATSIDALAVGVAFACSNTNIYASMITIGLTTFILSFLGVIIGNNFGMKYKKGAEISGGLILIFIGFKMLLEGILK